jgi:2-C-methyl-D-erythritol 4-phosphate cytidylyltransferase
MAAERFVGLIPAAGLGMRLGLGPKAFVPLGGRILLAWAVEALAPHVDEVVVAVPEGFDARARAAVPGATVVLGAASRQATVSRLLEACTARWVLVHDAARPFLPVGVARAVVASVRQHGAVTVALPVADTLFDVRAQRTVDRSDLHAIQTPQAFERTLLLRAHARAAESGDEATDDADLVRRLGHPVALVTGSPWLHKITGGNDLALAEAMVSAWRPDVS